MLLTEEQARTKWCPHSRVVHTECDYKAVVPANAFGDGKRSLATCCIASECMAWRWHDLEHQTHTKLHRDGADPAVPPGGGGWEAAIEDEDGVLWRRINQDRRGFCGIAGRVEG